MKAGAIVGNLLEDRVPLLDFLLPSFSPGWVLKDVGGWGWHCGLRFVAKKEVICLVICEIYIYIYIYIYGWV